MTSRFDPRFLNNLRYLLVFLVLPNLPFWLAPHFYLTITRPLLNLDYIVAALFALFTESTLAIIGIALCLMIDLFANTASYYYFSQHDFLSSVRFVSELSVSRIVITAFIITLIAVTWAAATHATAGKPSDHRKQVAASLLATLIVLAILKLYFSPSRYRDSLSIFSFTCNSASWRVVSAGWILAKQSNDSDGVHVPSASSVLLNKRALTYSKVTNIVLIVIESYGVSNDPSISGRLEKPFYDASVQKIYDVYTGTVPFEGPTVSAEFRELCGIRLGLTSVNKVKQYTENCLPTKMRSAGFETVAIHGFSGRMFDRKTWYPELQFENVIMLENLKQSPAMKICAGPFSGICDQDIAELIRQKLTSSPNVRHFIYWLTLNSHLPVEISEQYRSSCHTEDTSRYDESICVWMRLVERVNLSVAKLSIDPALPPTEFILVGDHPPPFLADFRRSQFSQREVPYIYLIPKYQQNILTN